MGGYGSGGHNRKRVTAESCVKLDAGTLRRAGFFAGQPHAWKWAYDNRGIHTCTVHVYADAEHDDVILRIDRDGREYDQVVVVTYSACHYGKRRAWLHCPLCDRRCFRLFYYDNTVNSRGEQVHYFACRHCRGLTYDLRRQRGFDRYQNQTDKYRDRITGGQPGAWDDPPQKPQGMHWTTFAPLMQRWMTARSRAFAAFSASLDDVMDKIPICTSGQ